MLGSEYEYFTGVLTSFMGPQVGCSTSLTISRASTARSQNQFEWSQMRNLSTYRAHAEVFPGYH